MSHEKDIKRGNAVVMWDIHKERWALPGRDFTTNRTKAEKACEKMALLIGEVKCG